MTVDAADPPDLAAVDELCRLALAARHLGCRVELHDVDPALHALLGLAGVADLVAPAGRPGSTGRDRRLDRDDPETDLP